MPTINSHKLAKGKRHTKPPSVDAEGNPITNRKLYGHKWRKVRLWFLKRNPLCETCKARTPPKFTEATEVDHVIPHRGNMKLFWDSNNFSAKCKPCHSAKTMTEINAEMRRVH